MPRTPSPEDFFSESPPDRIIGTESECNLQTTENLTPYAYLSQQAIEASGHTAVDGFFDNGARIYVDVGDHIEVDSAESLGPREAASADLAGLRLLMGIVEASDLPHNGLYRHSGTTIKDKNETSGYHENFLLPRSITHNRFFSTVVASHLTSRVWAGAGTIADGFQLSQKVDGIGDPAITSDYNRRVARGRKPMAMVPPVSGDKDTLGTNPAWARLEVRFADPALSTTGRYLGLAATSLVLRLVEHQDLIDSEELINWSFTEYASTAQQFSSDLSLSAVAETLNGKSASAIDYQEMLAESCLELSSRIELPVDELDAIYLWLDICDQVRETDLDSGEYSQLLTLLDFAPRHRYLSRHFTPGQMHSYNDEAVEANLIWDRILPAGGAMIYWQNVPSSYIPEVEAEDLLWLPPETRATIRGNLINKNYNRIIDVGWSSVEMEDNRGKISLNDPYATSIKNLNY